MFVLMSLLVFILSFFVSILQLFTAIAGEKSCSLGHKWFRSNRGAYYRKTDFDTDFEY